LPDHGSRCEERRDHEEVLDWTVDDETGLRAGPDERRILGLARSGQRPRFPAPATYTRPTTVTATANRNWRVGSRVTSGRWRADLFRPAPARMGRSKPPPPEEAKVCVPIDGFV
jgi:hypothetical protein